MKASRESINKTPDVLFECCEMHFYIVTTLGSLWRMCTMQLFPCVYLYILTHELLISCIDSTVYPYVNSKSSPARHFQHTERYQFVLFSLLWGKKEFNLYLNSNLNTLKFTYSLRQKNRYFGSEIPCTLGN